MLEQLIREERKKKDILLMTHLVLGYPSFEENRRIIAEMDRAEVELIELQIPFSEPIADGPTIMAANHKALDRGIRVSECLDFFREITVAFPRIAFLVMTYYNILFAYKEEAFLDEVAKIGMKGLIVPDLPPEEGETYLTTCQEKNLAPIFIFAPTHTQERLSEIARYSQGFVYCLGRKGVTGTKTQFDDQITRQIERYRNSTNLPLALGFGIQEKNDVDFLTGKIDIAVIGSQLIRIQEEKGITAVGDFLCHVRALC